MQGKHHQTIRSFFRRCRMCAVLAPFDHFHIFTCSIFAIQCMQYKHKSPFFIFHTFQKNEIFSHIITSFKPEFKKNIIGIVSNIIYSQYNASMSNTNVLISKFITSQNSACIINNNGLVQHSIPSFKFIYSAYKVILHRRKHT